MFQFLRLKTTDTKIKKIYGQPPPPPLEKTVSLGQLGAFGGKGFPVPPLTSSPKNPCGKIGIPMVSGYVWLLRGGRDVFRSWEGIPIQKVNCELVISSYSMYF